MTAVLTSQVKVEQQNERQEDSEPKLYNNWWHTFIERYQLQSKGQESVHSRSVVHTLILPSQHWLYLNPMSRLELTGERRSVVHTLILPSQHWLYLKPMSRLELTGELSGIRVLRVWFKPRRLEITKDKKRFSGRRKCSKKKQQKNFATASTPLPPFMTMIMMIMMMMMNLCQD